MTHDKQLRGIGIKEVRRKRDANLLKLLGRPQRYCVKYFACDELVEKFQNPAPSCCRRQSSIFR